MSSQCPLPERCGSCGWSHIPYQKQLDQKLHDINGSFRIKKLDLRVKEILESPKTTHYRNRMDFVIDFQGNVGLREKGKWWRVIDNHSCFIADENIDRLFKITRDWAKSCGLTFFDRKEHTGILRYAVIRTSSVGETMITIVTSAPGESKTGSPILDSESKLIEIALEKLNELANPTTLIWSINHTISDVSFGDELRTIAGPGYINEGISGVHYRISPNAFFQTNSYAAPLLLDTVREFAVGKADADGTMPPPSTQTLLDLYCGTGFFAVALAKMFKRTVGVELVPEAIRDARENAKLNNVEVEFHDAKTEEFNWADIGADVVILDPPRSGMHDNALKEILRVKPARIVYVSCNYKNFAREMVMLGEHYNVEKIRALDMFPHTPHVELVTALVRKATA